MKSSFWLLILFAAAAPLELLRAEQDQAKPDFLPPAETPAAPSPKPGRDHRDGPSPRPWQSPRSWFGVDVVKPDENLSSQIPDLPRGIGFVVAHIHENSPAASANIELHDVLWKYNDQLLVNESQFAALLRLSKPGEAVKVSLFRGGQAMEETVTLAERPFRRPGIPREAIDSVMLSGEHAPMRIVNFAEREAVYATEEGRAEVKLKGEEHHIVIHKPDGSLLFRGAVPRDDRSAEGVPEAWKGRICALRRGLEHSLGQQLVPNRQPRPRIIHPEDAEESVEEGKAKR
jgi:hypothetical protein